MAQILNDFTLSLSEDSLALGSQDLFACALYQAQTLGITQQVAGYRNSGNRLSLELSHPLITPIRCEVFGWSEASRWQATEHTMQAGCGLMSVHGRASGKAQGLGVDYVSTLTASLAIQGMLAAAIGQLRGGHFRRVTTSMRQGGLLSIGQYLAGATAAQEPELLLPGTTNAELRPPFVSADGVVFELETLSAEPWRRFWLEVGLEASTAGQAWQAFLMRYAKAISPLPADCMQALARLPMAKIRGIAAESGLSLSPVRSLAERMKDSNVAAELQLGPWHFQRASNHGKALAPLPANADLPLKGIKVVESCRRIQGPLVGYLLASLGAEVIRLELPGGDPLRGMSPSVNGCSVRFDALNRLKQVREVDIKSAPGRAEIEEMVRTADVFLHNWAPGKAAQLGLDYADLAQINPSLVYAYAGGWGKYNDDIAITATDFMVQAWSGIASLIGQHSGTRGGSLFTVLDVLGGVVAVQGILAALLNRGLNHQGAEVESSLLGAANLLSAPQTVLEMQSHRSPLSVLKGIYATKDDGLIAVECQDSAQLDCLTRYLDLSLDFDVLPRNTQLQTAFLANSAHHWQDELNRLGIPAAVVNQSLTSLVGDTRLNGDIKMSGYAAINTYWRFQ